MLREVGPSDPAVPHEHRLLTGDPASEIVRIAQEEGVEMIVMGTHGRTGLMWFLMGSVAEAVVRPPLPGSDVAAAGGLHRSRGAGT